METLLLVLCAGGVAWSAYDASLAVLQRLGRYRQAVRLRNWTGRASGPLPFQSFLYFIESNLERWVRSRALEGYLRRLTRLLERMGRTDLKAASVLGYQVLSGLAGLLLFGFLAGVLLAPAGLALGVVLPFLWLTDRAQGREKRILRDLPNALEVLSLCSEAGLSFEQALDQFVRTAAPSPLREEMARILEQARTGSSRKEALESAAARLDLTDFSLFSTSLIQAERFGTGVAATLRQLSLVMRDKQAQRAEKAVQEMPVKMLLPLVFFILPVTLLVIIGPVLLQFLQ